MTLLLPRNRTMLESNNWVRRALSTRPHNIVGLWMLNEAAGAVAFDRGPRRNHGAIVGTTLGQPGVIPGHSSQLFDGLNDYVNIYSAGLATHPDNELVTNGALTADASWTKGTGWSIAGVATHAAGTGSDLSQATGMIAGQSYTLVYTVSGRTAGTVTAKLGTTALTARSTDATFTETGVNATNTTLAFTASADFDGSLDNVSLKAASGNGFSGSEGSVILPVKMGAAGVWTDGTARTLLMLKTDANNYVSIARSTTNNRLVYSYVAGGTAETVTADTSSLDWLWLGLTWDKANDAVKAYLNGAQTGATQTTLGSWIGSIASATALIGAATQTPTLVHSGYAALVLLSNAVMTPSEMAQLMRAT